MSLSRLLARKKKTRHLYSWRLLTTHGTADQATLLTQTLTVTSKQNYTSIVHMCLIRESYVTLAKCFCLCCGRTWRCRYLCFQNNSDNYGNNYCLKRSVRPCCVVIQRIDITRMSMNVNPRSDADQRAQPKDLLLNLRQLTSRLCFQLSTLR